MTEILFKAKEITNEKWIEGYFIKSKWYYDDSIRYAIIPTENCLYPHCEISEWEEVIPETICRYTGLTDNNGNKIWENDVVKDNVILGTVVWDEKNAQFMIDDIHLGLQEYSDWWHEVEVIGNIFDNPELLQEGE